MNPFKEVIYKIGKDGRAFTLHWKNRCAPMVTGAMSFIGSAAPYVALAGVGVSAYGQYAAGQAAQAQAQMNAMIAVQNAKLKEREAAAELARRREEARQFQREGEALLATQQVQLAKGGVLTHVGTPGLLLEETAKELEADRMRILEEGFRAESYRLSEAENLRFQGRAYIAQGRNIAKGATLSSIGTLLTGIPSVYNMYPSAFSSSMPKSKTALATLAKY